MSRPPKTPAELARRFAASRTRERAEGLRVGDGAWQRQTFRLTRAEARDTARTWFELYPKAAYMTEVESWRVLENDLIEFTMRRLPSAE